MNDGTVLLSPLTAFMAESGGTWMKAFGLVLLLLWGASIFVQAVLPTLGARDEEDHGKGNDEAMQENQREEAE